MLSRGYASGPRSLRTISTTLRPLQTTRVTQRAIQKAPICQFRSSACHRFLATAVASESSSDTSATLTGAQLIFKLLRQYGVSSVSGYSGGAVLPLIDVFGAPPTGEVAIPFYLHANEAAAGHSAEAMAKVSGHLGCCVVTSGPGITNCITPMQDARADGVPMLFISGQVPTSAVGKESFQEVAAVEVTRPVTKWTFCVTDIRDIGWVMERACAIATSGRPGPVHIDLPKDVLIQKVPREYNPFDKKAIKDNTYDTSPSYDLDSIAMGTIYFDIPSLSKHGFESPLNKLMKGGANPEMIKAVIGRLAKSRRPLIHVGAGASGGWQSVRQLSSLLGIPVTSTLHGMGIVSEREDIALGMIGMHGSVAGNLALQKADLILGFGARFDDRTTGSPSSFAPEAFKAGIEGRGGVIHFDIEPEMFGKSGIDPTLAIQGDLNEVLPQFYEAVKNSYDTLNQKAIWRPWIEEVLKWKAEYPHYVEKSATGALLGKEVIQCLDSYLESSGQGDDKYVCNGVGNHQMYTCQLMTWTQPRQYVASGGLGTMGVGLPFAIGTRIVTMKDDPIPLVILVDGDGSFNMSSSDLQTVARYHLPMAIFICNDGKQSMVSSWQDFFFEGRQYITTNANPNYTLLAQAHGIKSYRIDSKEKLNEALPEIIETSKSEPVLIDCIIDSGYAFPICPPGSALDKTIYTLEEFREKSELKKGDAPS